MRGKQVTQNHQQKWDGGGESHPIILGNYE